MSAEIFQNILWKLKKLDCPIIANREDSWIKELLFTNSSNRLQLLEWFLSEIHSDLSEESSSMRLLNSPGEKVKHFLASFYSLGFCRKDEQDLVKGYCKKTEQLYFWQRLVDVLWEKYKTTQRLCGVSGTRLQGDISKEYTKSCAVLEQTISTVNMKDLLVENIPLFPPDVSEYAEEMTSTSVAAHEMKRLEIPTLEELKLKVGGKENVMSEAMSVATLEPLLESCQSYFDSTTDGEKISKASQLNCILSNLHADCQKFSDVYLQLKPLLKIPADDGLDSGPAFKRISGTLEHLQTFLSDVHSTKEATSCLERLVADDSSLNPDIHLNLQRSVMEDYVGTIQGSQNRMQKDSEKKSLGA